jgi:hypothetical protein
MHYAIDQKVNIQMMLNVCRSGLAAITCVMAPLAGCGVDDSAVDDVSTGTLTIVEADERAGKLVLRYDEPDRSIRYEMRLGPERQGAASEEERAAVAEPSSHQVDVRVFDAGGKLFFVHLGGNAFVDPSWETSSIDSEDGLSDRLALLARAVPAFQELELPPGMEPLRRTGIQVGLEQSQVGIAAAGPWRGFASTCRQGWCVNNGNLVRLWQSVLWADGMFSDLTEIDGEFGNKSHNWTLTWQSSWVPGDHSGIVGPNTWGAAEFQRVDLDPDGDICQGGVFRFTYHGFPTDRSFPLTMNCSSREWRFRNPRTGGWIDTSFNF